ncbi:YihY/virulence factor BrkB family protein [Actinoplanes couchii]|uniref:Ribonuclease n=1 Tax=Actinoplanes couchii TaxID=403638 RepID=A0ABQ3XNZ5_9ACTN|nr:YihY/virulence factor BrkB family protein [Actinoplanes couchii]MDR6318589.1 membrane protein [Actinoplanes couchii]GID60198.1 ribonuclease [Actinoplanes couchii]
MSFPIPNPATIRRNMLDPDSPDVASIWQFPRTVWWYVTRRSVAEFFADACPHHAAALGFHATLSLFPALTVIVSILGLAGQSPETITALISILDRVGAANFTAPVVIWVGELSRSPAPGWGLAAGLIGAIWTASRYVVAFSHAANHIHGVPEGRSVARLRAGMLGVTLLLLVLIALITLTLVVSEPVTEALRDRLGDGTVDAWAWLKVPALLAVAALVVALLLQAVPNVRLSKVRWLSPGAVVAITGTVAVSAGLSLFSHLAGTFSRTYGSLAGLALLWLWLWLINACLLLGAEVDTEVERARRLMAGERVESGPPAPPRATARAEKSQDRTRRLVAEATLIRRRHEQTPPTADEPAR